MRFHCLDVKFSNMWMVSVIMLLFVTQPVAAASNATASTTDAGLTSLLKKSLESSGGGIRGELKGKAWRPLTWKEAAHRALERNLDIKRSELVDAQARAALQEITAVFDPVFTLTADFNRYSQYDRIERDGKYSEGTEDITDQNGQAVSNAVFFEEGPVEYIAFDAVRPEGVYDSRIVASEKMVTGPQNSWNYQLSWFQQLPWGVAMDLNLGLLRRDTFYVNNYGARLANGASYGSYRRPWTASLGMDINLPLPWARNSGSYARGDTESSIARLELRQARARVQDIINGALVEVDGAFWSLVRGVRNIEVVERHLTNMAELTRRSERLFQLRRITAYERAHVAANFARVQAQLEQAWFDYFNASENLSQMLDLESGALLMPFNYEQGMSFDAQALLSQVPALPEQHPQVQQADQAVKVAELTYRFRKRDAAADISISAGVNLRQNHNVFGYSGAGEAVGHLSSPDSITQQYSMVYVYPLGNSTATAARQQAYFRQQQARVLRQAAGNAAVRRSFDAINAVINAQNLVELQRKNAELAGFIFEKISSRQQSRTANEYEIVIKADELLTARQQLVQAEIDRHLARVKYLSAQGKLPGSYALLVSENADESRRIALLQNSGALLYFREEYQ